MIAVRLLSRSLPCAPVFRNSRLPLTVSLDAKNVSERGEGWTGRRPPPRFHRVRAGFRRSCFTLCGAKEEVGAATSRPTPLSAPPAFELHSGNSFGLKYSPAPGEWANGRGAGTVSLTSHNGRAMPAAGRRPLSARACLIYLTTHSGRSA